MKNRILILAAMMGLVACDGPWNMVPSDAKGGDPQLQLSFFAVGGRDFDTLWIERTQPLTGSYDSTRVFVEEAVVRVARENDASDSVSYRPVPGSAIAWVPVRPHKVAVGATYAFRATVKWNAAVDWPVGKDIRTTELSATTTVPSVWSFSDSVLAPLEALNPLLAMGLPIPDSSEFFHAFDSAFPGVWTRYAITSATLDSLRQGIPTLRRIHWADTVWYIQNILRRVKNTAGQEVGLAYREYQFHPKFGEGFGGIFGVEKFDPTRARILDPITRTFMASVGKGNSFDQQDSARYFQPGNSRYYFGPYRAYAPELVGWPEKLLFSNVGIGYTGLNKILFYAVGPQYVAYNEALQSIAQGDRTAIPYTNVNGGIGYFAGALVDSFAITVQAVATDTFSVDALRGAACRRQWRKAVSDGQPFDSLVACKGVDFKDLANATKK